MEQIRRYKLCNVLLSSRWRFRVLVWDFPAGYAVLMATPLTITVTFRV